MQTKRGAKPLRLRACTRPRRRAGRARPKGELREWVQARTWLATPRMGEMAIATIRAAARRKVAEIRREGRVAVIGGLLGLRRILCTRALEHNQ